MILASQMRSLKLSVVIVSTKTGQSIKGLLADERRDGLVIRAAAAAVADGNGVITWHHLDGDVHIPMENIDFWQDGLPSDLLDTLADRQEAAERRNR